MPKHLEVRETIIEPEGDFSEMICIGKETTKELEVESAKYYIQRIIREKTPQNRVMAHIKYLNFPNELSKKQSLEQA